MSFVSDVEERGLLRRLIELFRSPRIVLVLGLLLVGLAFGLNVEQGLALKLDRTAPVWVADAIPPALSGILFHHDKRYTTLTAVNQAFYRGLPAPRTAPTIDAAIAAVASIHDPIDRSYVLLGNDDKGIVDFVEGAFRIFGLRTSSVFKGYFLLLGLSCVAYLLAYGARPAPVLALTSFLVMHALTMPALTFNAQLESPWALRAIPILSMVACLHGLLFGWYGKIRFGALALLVFQVAIMMFLIHTRTPTLWQMMTIVIASLIAVAANILKGRVNLRNIGPGKLWIAPVVCLAIGYGGLIVYRTVAFPAEYHHGEQIVTRVTWHNIFSGFALDPPFAKRFGLRIDDVSVIRATGAYLREQGRAADWVALGGTSPNFRAIRWAPYDRAVRDMVIDRCSQYKLDCLKTFFWYKPVALQGTLAWIYGLRKLPPNADVFVSPEIGSVVRDQIIAATRQMDAAGLRANPFGLPTLLLLPFVGLLAGSSWQESRLTLLAIGALAIGSTTPSIIGYPAPHAVAEPAIAFAMLLQVSVIIAAAAGLFCLVDGNVKKTGA